MDKFRGHTAISDFRLINRRFLLDCPDPNPYLAITVDADSPLPDEANVTVTVSGVLDPDESDWIAMVSPSGSRYVCETLLMHGAIYSCMFKFSHGLHLHADLDFCITVPKIAC